MIFHLYECGLTVCVFVFVAGNISTLAALDRESKSRYWLSVYAQDHGVAPLHSRVEVSVNSNYCVTLSIGTSIAKVPLFARNESVPGANTLFCQLLSMNPACWDRRHLLAEILHCLSLFANHNARKLI